MSFFLGYAKLKERHSSGEKLDRSDSEDEQKSQKKETEQDVKEVKEVKEAKGDTSKLSSVSHEIFGAPARIVKRAVEHSKYQQFVNADNDDFEKETPSELRPPPHPQADSSSEGHDGAERVDRYYQKDRDFGYQELDDEFGRKYSAKPKTDHNQYNAMDDASDQTQSQYEETDRRPSLISMVTGSAKSHGQTQQAQAQQHDPIVGHEHGGRPLLDDDELSDSEVPKETVPSRGSSAMSASSTLMSVGTPTTSPLSAHSEEGKVDPFSGAPFIKKKDSKKKRPKVKSPAQKITSDDPFAKAPFRAGSAGLAKTRSPPQSNTPTMYINQAVDQEVDPFISAPFKSSRSSAVAIPPGNEVTTVSPASVEMRSPSQSPEVQNCAMPPTPPVRDILMQMSSSNTSTSPLSPAQVDLFGSGNFAEMSYRQMHEQMNRLDQRYLLHAQYQSPPHGTAPSFPAQSPPQVSMSPQNNFAPSGTQPTEDLFGARPFEVAVRSEMHSSDSRKTQGVQDNKYVGTVNEGGVRKPTHRKNSGSRQRRRGSSGSSGSDGKPSPRSSKKDKYYSRSTELLHDENVEVLLDDSIYGGPTKNKPKTSKKSSKEKQTTAFANLSFMDDSEKDMDMADLDCVALRSESHMNLASDAALKTSNAANYPEEGSHTLPRAGAKKHRVLPVPPDAEPFTIKKKSGGKIFK